MFLGVFFYPGNVFLKYVKYESMKKQNLIIKAHDSKFEKTRSQKISWY